MEIMFQKPDFLWFLLSIPVIIIVHFFTLKSTNRKALKFANFEAIERVTGGQVLSKNLFLLFIRIIIIFLFILALSGATLSYVGQGTNFDFSLAIDASNSMLINDLEPNRMDVAKESAINFINDLSNNNEIAIVSFGPTALLESSLTNDLVAAKNAVRKIQPLETGGTSIGDAIISSVNSMFTSKNPKVIILLTDGQSNTGADVTDAVDYARLKQVTIHTIGIGTEKGGEYTEGVSLILDEITLQDIAASTGGKYYRANSASSLKNSFLEIEGLTQTTLFKDLALSFTLIALVLLLIEWILFNTKYRTIP